MARQPSAASTAAGAAGKPKKDRENDPRNPRKRLEAFFDHHLKTETTTARRQ